MKFTYDPRKNTQNLKDHGISLDFASKAFFDPNRCEIFDEGNSSYDPNDPESAEYQFITIGFISDVSIYVPYTITGPDSYHLISAREATRYEVKTYYQGKHSYV